MAGKVMLTGRLAGIAPGIGRLCNPARGTGKPMLSLSPR
jgi:hypothetical protein